MELAPILERLASAAARIVEDDAKPTLVHMRELNRCRSEACRALAALTQAAAAPILFEACCTAADHIRGGYNGDAGAVLETLEVAISKAKP